MGLDLGTKTIGVAVSDADRRLATGVETIQRTAFKADAARVLAIAAERNAVGFVLGLPINMDGSEGPRAQSGRDGECAERRGAQRARRLGLMIRVRGFVFLQPEKRRVLMRVAPKLVCVTILTVNGFDGRRLIVT